MNKFNDPSPYKINSLPLLTSSSAMNLILSLTLFLLSLSHGCSGDRSQIHHRCDIKKLSAAVPSLAIKDEAGVTEIWNYQIPEFLCAGVVAVRLTVLPGGLVLPSYNTAPFVSFVLQGRGVQGVVIPECPNTVQTDYISSGGEEKTDHHQKLFRSREGDVISSPANVVQWTYNDGNTDFVTISLFDYDNFQNQLDRKVRSFFVAGKSQQSREYSGNNGGNIFSGLNEEILREFFSGIDHETIDKIRAQNDERGSVVFAPDLQLQIPEEDGIDESQTLCDLKFRHSLNNSSQSVYLDPCIGRINTINGETLPILRILRLSAAQIVLHKNAIRGPQWTVNANTVVYITKGDGIFSVVNDEGNAVFDDIVHSGHILVVQQGFTAVVRAGGEGLEWVEMRTNDDVITSPVAGRNSVLGAIPAEVLAMAFDVSTEKAVRLKNMRGKVGICSRPLEEFNDRENNVV